MISIDFDLLAPKVGYQKILIYWNYLYRVKGYLEFDPDG